jgi:hypothetical protein
MSSADQDQNDDCHKFPVLGTDNIELDYFSTFVVLGVSAYLYKDTLLSPDGNMHTRSDPIYPANDDFLPNDRKSVFIKIISWLITCLTRGVCPTSFEKEEIRVINTKKTIYGGSLNVRVFMLSKYVRADYEQTFVMYQAFLDLCLEYEIVSPSDIVEVTDKFMILDRLNILLVKMNTAARLHDETLMQPALLYTTPIANGQDGTMSVRDLTTFIDDNAEHGDISYVSLTLSLMHHADERIKDAFVIDPEIVRVIYTGKGKVLTLPHIYSYAIREWFILNGKSAQHYVGLVRFKYASAAASRDILTNLMRSLSLPML